MSASAAAAALGYRLASEVPAPAPVEGAPTARDLFDAMVGLRTGRLTPDECRAVNRRSREMNGSAEHERLHVIAVANLVAA